MEYYYFSNHFTTIMQGCYNPARLQTPCTNYHNLVTILSQPYKVAARLLQPSYFHMGGGHKISEFDKNRCNGYGYEGLNTAG